MGRILGRPNPEIGPHQTFPALDRRLIPKYCTAASIRYLQAVTLLTEKLDFLVDSDQAWIIGHGIAEWLKGSLSS